MSRADTGRRFRGRAALVVGAASGLGAAIAERLAEEGAHVCLADRNVEAARVRADALVARGLEAVAVGCDITRADEVARAVQAACVDGALHALVLSAAVETRRRLTECSDEEWQTVLDVNLKGAFLCLRAAIPRLVAAGGGAVVALGSILGSMPQPEYAAYATSKAALVNLCKQAAIEHAPDRVRVNVVAPGACEAGLFLETVARAADPQALREMIAAGVPLRRLGTSDDVCAAVLFLLSDEAAYISGTVLPLDGGLAARRS